MTDQTGPEQPPAPSEMERLRDSVDTLQTIVNRVREAVGTDTPAPAPVRESFRVRQLKTQVSDAKYERNRAQERAEAASRVGTQYMVRAERAEAALQRVHDLADLIEAGAPWADNLDNVARRIRDAATIPPGPDPVTPEREQLRAVIKALGAAETQLARARAVYHRWVAAGPPPLGTSLARWWDARLAELHGAIRPTTAKDPKPLRVTPCNPPRMAIHCGGECLTIAPSDETLNRTDRIALVGDTLTCVAGTPGGPPPTCPAGSHFIAEVEVPRGTTAITAAHITGSGLLFYPPTTTE